jgi:Fe-Mn family superoxide dismutase
MAFKLPKLPYANDALEPFISEKTIEFHYGKHHQTYVNNVNSLIPGTAFENATLEEIILKAEGGIFNNGAQVWNHTFYFMQFNPEGCKEPKDELKEAIEIKFGSFDNFKEEFSKAAGTLFGSGWAWLVKGENGELEIVQTSNAVLEKNHCSPAMYGNMPTTSIKRTFGQSILRISGKFWIGK